jgi:hypothetical protein
MSRADDTRAALQRLAVLLSDQHGAEILAEMQKAGALAKGPSRGADRSRPANPAETAKVGIWQLVSEASGVALRADADLSTEASRWAAVRHVPGPGDARRVVLLGESAARGFLLDPDYAPATVLQRSLDADAPGGYQCVDLACTGADLRTLSEISDALPTLRADTIVLYAGNNWMLPRYTAAHLSALGRAWGRGGRKALRAEFWSRVVRPEVERFLARLLRAAAAGRSELVIVVPEFNLLGWHPAEATSVPRLPAPSLAAWCAALDRCGTAAGDGRWHDAQDAAVHAMQLDGGTSPASLHVAGLAAMKLGDHKLARHWLELSRDVAHGTLLSNTPGVTTEIQECLIAFCESHDLACIDLRATLASSDGTELPDPSYFLDYCHLSASGIDMLVDRLHEVIDRRLPAEPACGPTAPSVPRAQSHLLAACHAAYCDQPQPAIRRQLELALSADPGIRTTMHRLLDLLEGAGPAWAQPATEGLRASAQLARYLDSLLTRSVEGLGLWSLRDELGRILGRVAGQSPADLIAGTSTGGVRQVFRPPNHTPGRAYHQATTGRTRIGLSRSSVAGGAIDITARTPSTAPAVVRLNGADLGQAALGATWTTVRIEVPSDAIRPGVNWLEIDWPVPDLDVVALDALDESALGCGRFPAVMPVFGDLYAVCWHDLGALL